MAANKVILGLKTVLIWCIVSIQRVKKMHGQLCFLGQFVVFCYSSEDKYYPRKSRAKDLFEIAWHPD